MMNKKLFLPIIAVTVALSFMLTGPVSASAAVIQNMKMPYSTTVPGPSEDVQVTGVIHLVVAYSDDMNIGLSHFNLEQVSGVGLTSGATYKITGILQHTWSIKPPYPMEDTFVVHMNVIGKGSAENSVTYMITHFTINANGEVAVDFTHMPSP